MWAKGTQLRRRGLLVRCKVDGLVGWGEVAPPPHETPDLDALIGLGRRACAGMDPLWDLALRAVDARGVHGRLRAGIATAVLDVQAQHQGRSLADLLAHRVGGPMREEVLVNGLVGAVDPEEARRSARQAVGSGVRVLKIKCTADRAADLARVRAVRQAVGPEVALRVDANGSWDAAWAEAHLLELEAAVGLDYVEQPLPADDLVGAALLRERTGVKVALDEAVTGPSALQRILEAGAADVLVLKPQRLGGPDRAAALLRIAQAAGLGCVVTNSLETAVGRVAALHVAALLPPAACGLATGDLLAEDVAAGVPVEAGRMRVPGPGLGVAPEGWALVR